MQRARPKLSAALAASAALAFAAGCGESGGNPDADPAAVVPGSAPLYIEAVVKPEGDQKADLEALLEKVAKTDDVGAQLKKAIDDSLREEGLSYDEDIEPWIGERAGLFVSSFAEDAQGAAVMASEDTDKAIETLRKGADQAKERSYKDTTYYVDDDDSAFGAVGDYVVAGTEAGVKQVIDTNEGGEKLSDNENFKTTDDEVGDGLAFVYADPGALINAVASGGGVDRAAVAPLRQILAGQGTKAIGASVNALSDAFEVETVSIGGRGSGTEGGDAAGALASAPSDAWLALGIGNVGGRLEDALQQISQVGALAGANVDQVLEQLRQQAGLDVREDIIGWMGDAVIYLRGTSIADIGGALVVDSKDPEATQRGVARIARLLRGQGLPVESVTGVQGVDNGVSIRLEQGLKLFLVTAGDKFVAAVGESTLESAINPSGTLADESAFKTASGKLGDGLKPVLYFDMQQALQLAEGVGAADDPDFQQALPYLRAFTSVVAGGQQEGDVGRGKLVVGVR
jgi:hypothetical protein